MKRILAYTVAGAALLTGIGALAQQSVPLDVDAIEARAGAFMDEARAIVQGAEPTEAQVQDAEELVSEALEQVDGLDAEGMVSEGAVDFGEIVRGAKGISARPEGSPLLISFVSLSMPPESLARVIEETTQAGGLVVFRGFPIEGAGPFVQSLIEVAGEDGAHNITIDPRLFRAFSVDRVPSYVAVSRSFDPCDSLDCVTTPPPHDKLVGNVPLHSALERFIDSNGPGTPVARVGLANLRAR